VILAVTWALLTGSKLWKGVLELQRIAEGLTIRDPRYQPSAVSHQLFPC
jgi:hypothetical protein